jgi:hypothetical protein
MTQHITPHSAAGRRRDGNAAYYPYTPDSRQHFIEQTVKVYLRLADDGTRWIVDGPTVDGYPLDSALDGGASRSECGCGRPHDCRRALEHANQLPLPTATEPIAMIANALD